MSQRYCGNCGSELAEGQKFCGNCGSPVHATARVDTPEADADVPPPPRQDEQAQVSPPQERRHDMMGDIQMVLIILIMFPVYLLVSAIAYALVVTGGGSGYQIGLAAGKALIEQFFLVFPAAALLTYLTVRWNKRRRQRAEGSG